MKKCLSCLLAVLMLFTSVIGSTAAMAAVTDDGVYQYTIDDDFNVTIDKFLMSESPEYNEIHIPSEILYTVKAIGPRAFYNYTGISYVESVVIPHSIEKIGAMAFLNCSLLSSITFSHSSVKSIGNYAFSDCSSLENITLPASLETLGMEPFMGCEALRTIDVEEGNTHFTSDQGVLLNAAKTQLIKIPADYKTASYTVPEGVTEIAANAVYNANTDTCKLKTLILPSTLSYVEEAAVNDNAKLEKILYLGSEEDWKNNVTVEDDNDELTPVAEGGKLVFHPEHTFETESETPASCTEGGVKVSVCTECGVEVTEETEPLKHDYQLTGHQDASYAAAGYDEYTCTRCKDSYRVEIPKFEGIIISVKESPYGTATITGGAEYDGEGRRFEEGERYSLRMSYDDTKVDFIGWAIGSRIVSENALYTSYAYTSLEFTPVFVEKQTEEIQTVVFLNKYGDILASGEAGKVAIPDKSTLNLPGYTFLYWTLKGSNEEITEAEIAALTTSAQIVGKYEKANSEAYTITADGATITLPKGIENGAIPFDTKATVKFNGADAIQCGDTVVAFGDTYTFYVGGNITLTPVSGEVEEAATVKLVGANRVEGTDTKFYVYATRAVPADWTAIDQGFVYAEANNAALPADKAAMEAHGVDGFPADGVRIKHTAPTESEQFALKVGISSGKSVKFYGYVTVQKGEETLLVFSDPITVNG